MHTITISVNDTYLDNLLNIIQNLKGIMVEDILIDNQRIEYIPNDETHSAIEEARNGLSGEIITLSQLKEESKNCLK